VRAKRAEGLQVAFVALFYFSFIGALVSRLLGPPFVGIQPTLDRITAVTAGLSGLFLLGILLSTRYLSLLDVDLFFLSEEARGV